MIGDNNDTNLTFILTIVRLQSSLLVLNDIILTELFIQNAITFSSKSVNSLNVNKMT